MIFAFVLIAAEPKRIVSLAEELAELPGVREVHSTAGSEVSLIAMLGVTTHEQIAEIVTEAVCSLEGVKSTQTLISFRRYSSQQLDVAYDIFSSD